METPLFAGVDVVIDCDEPCLQVLALLTEQEGMNTAHVAGQVLHDHKIISRGRYQRLGLRDLLTVHALPTSLATDGRGHLPEELAAYIRNPSSGCQRRSLDSTDHSRPRADRLAVRFLEGLLA